MLTYMLRRVLYMIPLLLVVSLISFSLIKIMPGDYLTNARLNPQITAETFQQLVEQYGLDQPFIVQYLYWLKGVARGDFGQSFDTHMGVFETLFLGNRLLWTVILATTTLALTWIFAIPIGIYSATHQYKPSDHVFTFFGFLGLSIPNFFLALVLLWLLVVVFRVGDYGLGVGGLLDGRFFDQPFSWAKFVNYIWHLWPVWLVIGTGGMAGLIRLMRGSLLPDHGPRVVPSGSGCRFDHHGDRSQSADGRPRVLQRPAAAGRPGGYGRATLLQPVLTDRERSCGLPPRVGRSADPLRLRAPAKEIEDSRWHDGDNVESEKTKSTQHPGNRRSSSAARKGR